MEIGSKGLKRIRTDPKTYPGSCFMLLLLLFFARSLHWLTSLWLSLFPRSRAQQNIFHYLRVPILTDWGFTVLARDKCKVLNLGPGKQLYNYQMGETWLGRILREPGGFSCQWAQHESTARCYCQKTNVTLNCLSRSARSEEGQLWSRSALCWLTHRFYVHFWELPLKNRLTKACSENGKTEWWGNLGPFYEGLKELRVWME